MELYVAHVGGKVSSRIPFFSQYNILLFDFFTSPKDMIRECTKFWELIFTAGGRERGYEGQSAGRNVWRLRRPPLHLQPFGLSQFTLTLSPLLLLVCPLFSFFLFLEKKISFLRPYLRFLLSFFSEFSVFSTATATFCPRWTSSTTF